MTFYDDVPWWNTRYKIRSNITVQPNELLPGSESLCGIKLERQALIGKLKTDYSDLYLIRQIDFETSEIIPFYVIEEDETYLSVIFKPTLPILDENKEYYIYYCGKAEARLDDALDILDKAQLDLVDFGQLDTNTRWTFQKPTEYWVSNITNQPNAKAVFEFVGHRADFFFQIGPTYGKLEYQINNGPYVSVDCYSATASISDLVNIDTNQLAVNKIRFTVLGQKNPGSNSTVVELVKVQYHQVLIGDLSDEEFYSDISNTFQIGS